MLRVSEQAAQSHDRYGHPPLHYLGWNVPPTPFMEQVAEEAAAALDERAALAASSEPVGRFVDDGLALKLVAYPARRTLPRRPTHTPPHAHAAPPMHASAAAGTFLLWPQRRPLLISIPPLASQRPMHACMCHRVVSLPQSP